jgi:Trk-type K+ transport system membrane component
MKPLLGTPYYYDENYELYSYKKNSYITIVTIVGVLLGITYLVYLVNYFRRLKANYYFLSKDDVLDGVISTVQYANLKLFVGADKFSLIISWLLLILFVFAVVFGLLAFRNKKQYTPVNKSNVSKEVLDKLNKVSEEEQRVLFRF